MKLSSHLEGNKAAQLINILLHLIQNATDANTLLTAEGQVGYNLDVHRVVYRANNVVRQLLHNGDLFSGDLTAIANVGNMGGLLAEAAATATALNSIKQELLTAINNSSIVTEAFDASTATQFPAGATANKRYRATVAGLVRGIRLEVGDIIFPGITNPSVTDPTNWVFIQGNVDAATEYVFGLVKLAPIESFTAADVHLFVQAHPDKAVRPWHIQQAIAAAQGDVDARSAVVTQSITVGSNEVIHNLGANVIVQVQDSAYKTILLDWQPNAAQNGVVFSSLTAFAGARFTFTKATAPLIPVLS